MPTSKSADPILVTMGEPAGIGPEVAVSAWRALDGHIGNHPLLLVGDREVFAACGEVPAAAVLPVHARARRTPGKPDPANCEAVVAAIAHAVALARSGEAHAIVTAPINKHVLMQSGFRFPGHTDFLSHLTGGRAVMMLAGKELRVVPLTVHVPLSQVPFLITTQSIVETAEITLNSLRRDFAISEPRLAVAGLNPHAGENGELGGEEEAVIAPAIAELQKRGYRVFGPLPSDTMFHAEARAGYDAALCMYHDQALIPLKTLSFWEGVNATLGLPIVRTSPDHGTAFEIAGQGKADPRSMLAAIAFAARMADTRWPCRN